MGLDDYVANIDAHTESYTSFFNLTGCKFLGSSLELQSSSNRLNRAWKLRQETVTGVLHEAAPMLRDRGGYTLR